MRLFECQSCGHTLYFENRRCERCGSRLGYLPWQGTLSALLPEGQAWLALADRSRRYRFCVNAEADACNWLVDSGAADPHCVCCRHNRTIPDLTWGANAGNWRRLELAKHRLFYTLLRLRLPLPTRAEDPAAGLEFDVLADSADPSAPKVLTGHDSGLITLNIAEADDAERERRRSLLGEPYRTLLGHFRHEIAHFYWERLVARDAAMLATCRASFGDERADYAAALAAHYAHGAPADWRQCHVTAYAAAHPWEDFAETWAHYLHIVDTLETASAFGLRVRAQGAAGDVLASAVEFDPYAAPSIGALIDAWLPLTFAMNSLSRSMGQPDLYPFLLTEAVIGKLGYIHRLIGRQRGG